MTFDIKRIISSANIRPSGIEEKWQWDLRRPCRVLDFRTLARSRDSEYCRTHQGSSRNEALLTYSVEDIHAVISPVLIIYKYPHRAVNRDNIHAAAQAEEGK